MAGYLPFEESNLVSLYKKVTFMAKIFSQISLTKIKYTPFKFNTDVDWGCYRSSKQTSPVHLGSPLVQRNLSSEC